jgi:hypothetical protein
MGGGVRRENGRVAKTGPHEGWSQANGNLRYRQEKRMKVGEGKEMGMTWCRHTQPTDSYHLSLQYAS